MARLRSPSNCFYRNLWTQSCRSDLGCVIVLKCQCSMGEHVFPRLIVSRSRCTIGPRERGLGELFCECPAGGA